MVVRATSDITEPIRVVRKKKKPKTGLAKLRDDADDAFSLYIRYRDADYSLKDGWSGICISCERRVPFKQFQAGHFVTRTVGELFLDGENVNGQCLACNRFGQGEQYLYGKGLDKKYGEGTADRLMARRVIKHKFTKEEYEAIIHDTILFVDHRKRFEEGDMGKKPTKVKIEEDKTKKKRSKKPENTAITNPEDPANKKYNRRKINLVQK